MEPWSLAALVPGLWTAGLAALLLVALRRWFDPVPWAVAVVFAAVILVLLGPFLFGGGVMLPLDMVTAHPPWRGLPPGEHPVNPLHFDHVMQIVPAQAAVREITAAGEWPLWNPWLAAGQPLLADPLSQPLQPLVLLARPLPLHQAVAVTAALRLFLAMTGTFLLLRRLGLGTAPALAGALGWGLGGWMVHWLGWHQATVGALLPWLLYALLRTGRPGTGAADPTPSPDAPVPPPSPTSPAASAPTASPDSATATARRRDLVLLGTVLFGLLTAGHPETVVYTLLAGGVFALGICSRGESGVAAGLAEAPARSDGGEPREGDAPRAGRRRAALRRRLARSAPVLARQAATGAVALALAAPVILPFVEYLPQMVRYQRVQWVQEALQEAGPWRGWRTPEERRASLDGAQGRLLGTLAPGSFGGFVAGGYHGPSNANEDLTGYAGGALLLAALLALWPARRRLPGERFFLALWLLGLLVLARPPGLLPLIEGLPALGHSPNQHTRVLLLVGFGAAAAGACLLERWRRGVGPPRAVVAAATALLGTGVAWSFLGSPRFGQPAPAPPGWPEGPRLVWMIAELVAVATVGAVLLVGRRRGPAGARGTVDGDRAPTAGRGGGGWAKLPPGALPALLLVAAVAGELILLHQPLHPAAPARLFYPETAASAFLRDRLPAVGERVERDERGAGIPEDGGAAARAYGRFTALGPTYPPNTAILAGLMDVRSSGPAQPAPFSSITERLKSPETVYGDLLSRVDAPVLDLLAVRYLLTWPDAAAPPPARSVLEAPGVRPVVRIYERPGALPLVFLPPSAEAFEPGTSWLDWIFSHGDYGEHSLVQATPGGLPGWAAGAPDRSRVTATRLRPARWSADLELAEERLLATSLYQDGQWRLLADGRPVAPVLVNGPFAGAWLPAGTARVEALYRPGGFVAGCLLAALGWAAVLLLAVGVPRRWAVPARRAVISTGGDRS